MHCAKSAKKYGYSPTCFLTGMAGLANEISDFIHPAGETK